MIFRENDPPVPAWHALLQAVYRADEDVLAAEILDKARLPDEARARIHTTARNLVKAVRANRQHRSSIDAFMHAYDLSTEEGLVLMCLAEALLRVPDTETADRLIRDKLSGTHWEKHLGSSRSIFVNASTLGLMMTGRILGAADLPDDAPRGPLHGMVARMGEPVIREALRKAIRVMGRQFVLGRTIQEAQQRGLEKERKGYRYSFDMLGEAARTEADAQAYFKSYSRAIEAIGRAAQGKGPVEGNGISVKLSALHPRYESAHRTTMLNVLTGRLLELARQAKQQNIALCVDAEESERLELSLELIEKVYSHSDLEGWDGFGLAVQAYQKRSRAALELLASMVGRVGRRMNVRLVKGAYWDTEIKRSQEQGLGDYPVWTRKVTTDVSYIACARYLLENTDSFFPQFATHNAQTVATLLEIGKGRVFEFQRLHGMGEELYDEIVDPAKHNRPCRIYAPVGGHAELLSYLVRRLLENGANSSFVNRLEDDKTPIDLIITDPAERLGAINGSKRHPNIPLPRNLFPDGRTNSRGLDLSDMSKLQPVAERMEATSCGPWSAGPIIGGDMRLGDSQPVRNPADRRHIVGHVREAGPDDIEEALARAQASQPAWEARPTAERAEIFEHIATAMEEQMPELMAICTREAGKTIADGVAEVREAVDFLRYYARCAQQDIQTPVELPATGGKVARIEMRGRGVFVCISPWNFPLAIFTGQITAALAAGNAVIAKPAEQTSLMAARVVRIFHAAGVPGNVLALLPGSGETVGSTLIADPRVNGVAFTGSVEVAHIISRSLARRTGGVAPLIAETGGQNVMLVDSSALPEQVVRDAVLSAFGSAGQRCSALRVMYVQEEIAETIITMLKGAMQELVIGDPALLETDIGPVIDKEALDTLQHHASHMTTRGRLIHQAPLPASCAHGTFFSPRAYEIEGIEVLEREVFGPMLHVVRYKAKELDRVLAAIRNTQYGLTMGIHTRIDKKARAIQAASRVGNTYVNRNMIGAVVGVQPFGGEGLSGTGPKAGGPNYVARFAKPVVTHETMRNVPDIQAAQPGSSPTSIMETVETHFAKAIVAAHEVQPKWDRFGGIRRATILETAAMALETKAPSLAALLARKSAANMDEAADIHSACAMLRLLAAQSRQFLSAPLKLPGPTGEYNELQYHGRGVILCMSEEGAAFSAIAAQIGACVASGCPALILPPPELAETTRHLVDRLYMAGAPEHALIILDQSSSNAAMEDERIHGVSWASAEWTGTEPATIALASLLAMRRGPIIPLVSEPFGPHYLMRFMIERTLTIDLTAAGGNASLLTLNEGPADGPPL
ncbi:bifunctional proline dehydrogenase/L-glutamate gamma-semialdehyde dehydrogenase PutA [Xanthobacter sp. TB0139]|uniref:bifunctional proline dehydrogenase/L-glutamate gamma-semialdehyde dehydrogenase PutA n=1 Tax=Xanthobacter sp. TB0139 TaxID=3459178 RepID=UPI00403A220B